MKKGKAFDNRGVATIFTVIVATVVMVFCLALLMVSYTLYTSAQRVGNRSKCRALAVSLSEELRRNIEDVHFTSYEEECKAKDSGEDKLWFYLRDNLNSESWMGYRDRDNCASHEEADRTFDISTGQAVDGMDADTDVTMYWVDEGSDYGIVLYVRVESMMGDLSYSITSSYSLSADEAYGDCEDYKRWIWQYEGNGEYEK